MPGKRSDFQLHLSELSPIEKSGLRIGSRAPAFTRQISFINVPTSYFCCHRQTAQLSQAGGRAETCWQVGVEIPPTK